VTPQIIYTQLPIQEDWYSTS